MMLTWQRSSNPLTKYTGSCSRGTKKANLNIPVALKSEGTVPSGGRKKFREKCTGRKKKRTGERCQAKMKTIF